MIRRKTAILSAAYLLALSAALGLYGYLQHRQLAVAQNENRNRADYAFEELCRSADELDTALSKAALAASPSLRSTLCADGYAAACAGLTALGQLDYDTVELEQSAAFLNAAAESCHSLLRSAGRGEALTEEERSAFGELVTTAGWFHEQLENQRSALTEESGGTCEALCAMETDFPPLSQDEAGDYPFLENREKVSEHAASLVAAAFAGKGAPKALCEGIVEAKEPFYKIRVGDSTAFVTVRGGQLLRFFAEQGGGGEERYTEAEALSLSGELLKKRGYGNMRELAHTLRDGCLVSSWCAQEGDVLCLADSVTLSMSLNDASVLSFDATDYVQHHHSRVLDSSGHAREAALALLEDMQVQEEFLALLPEDEEEKLMLGFRCTTPEGRNCFVFCSAATGVQERIVFVRSDGSFV